MDKVLVVGSGGREHALAWKLSQSPRVKKVYCAPGNAGIAEIAECVNIKADDIYKLREFAKFERIDLTVVGPEAPLSRGIVDAFRKEGLRAFGPSKDAAQLESSKQFAKDFMRTYGIPTAEYKIFNSYLQAEEYVRLMGAPIVIKADGLAAGKGVFVCSTFEEAVDALKRVMRDREFGDAGDTVVVEQCLVGEEASFMAISDGEVFVPLASSQDHKRIFDGDRGPNTGGMGAYSPAPVVDEKLTAEVMETVMYPVLNGMKKEGIVFKGVLYAGLMICGGKPYVLEFNCRFGDPETQPILSRLDSDLCELMNASIDGTLSETVPVWKEKASVCVVMAAGGYPGKYENGKIISGLEEAARMEDVMVFHAGTAQDDGNVVTAGGRVLGVTATGDDIAGAIKRAYEAAAVISWDGAQYRKDIGARALR
jgi:phosphoribosylamine--glycine ligase